MAKQNALLEEIRDASKLGANYAERAAEQKMMEDLKEEDEAVLTLPFMVQKNSIEIPSIGHSHCFNLQTQQQVLMAMQNDETFHAMRRWIQASKTTTKGSWLRKTCRKIFDGHLLGRQYLVWPSG